MGVLFFVVRRDGVEVPVDKVLSWIRGGSAKREDVDRLRDFRRFKQEQRKKYNLNFEQNELKLNSLERAAYSYGRSQEMLRTMKAAGLENNPATNAYIIDGLLAAGRSVSAENRFDYPVVVKGNGGSVKMNTTWVIFPDGTRYLATVTLVPKGKR